ncbi:MAG: hypothetical protein ABI605_15090 [Rhizobacter sp.]
MTALVLTAMPAFFWTQSSQRDDAKNAKEFKKAFLSFFASFASFFAPLASKKTVPHHGRPGNRKAA